MEIKHLVDKCFSIGMLQNREEYTQLLEYLKQTKPVNILEIGTAKGGTFYGFAQIASGKKITIDLPDGPPEHGGLNRDAAIRRNLGIRLWSDNVIDILGHSHDLWIVDYVYTVLRGESLDFLFIDGDHAYDNVKKDFELYAPMVKIGGAIAFHDIKIDAEPVFGVARFWKEICYKDKREFIHPNTNGSILGIGLTIKDR